MKYFVWLLLFFSFGTDLYARKLMYCNYPADPKNKEEWPRYFGYTDFHNKQEDGDEDVHFTLFQNHQNEQGKWTARLALYDVKGFANNEVGVHLEEVRIEEFSFLNRFRFSFPIRHFHATTSTNSDTMELARKYGFIPTTVYFRAKKEDATIIRQLEMRCDVHEDD